MKNQFQIRIMFWKKQWPSLLFWLFFPIITCLTIINMTEELQKDAYIPIAIVMEEQTQTAKRLYDKISQSELVESYLLSEEEALQQLEIHELDSVFIIHEGYEEQIEKGNRNNLLTGYQSNLSFAYSTVSEMIISMVQEETVRSKAAHTIIRLNEEYNGMNNWTWDEIVSKSIETEQEQNLISTNFHFHNATEKLEQTQLFTWDKWGLWAIFSLLSSLLLMDWIIKEKSSHTFGRFAFSKTPWHHYLLYHLLIYFVLFTIIDLITIYLFKESYTIDFIFSITSYRLMITILSCLIALAFKNKFIYYGFAFILTLIISIISGVILPIEGQLATDLKWLHYLNPIKEFQMVEITIFWLIICVIPLLIWFVRKEFNDA